MPAPEQHPLFHFTVQWGGTRVGFSEVTGLTQEGQATEHRDGSSAAPIKMPDVRKFSNITFKRGVVKGDNDFARWLSTVKCNTGERRDLVVRLLDEKHGPIMTWKVRRAFPVKVDGTPLKAGGNEIAIASVELAHEGLEIQNDPS